MACSVLAASLVAAGCGSAGSLGTPALTPPASSNPASEVPGRVTFTACSRTRADPGTTNLRARQITATTLTTGGPYDVTDVPVGRVLLEHVADLKLTDGRIGAGSGADAAFGQTRRIAVTSAGRIAPVTLAVLDSRTSGRRVAFLEIRLSPNAPVSWSNDARLTIGTDGGDGGFNTGEAPAIDDDSLVDDSVEAFFPKHDSRSGNVCVLRSPARTGVVDTVMFSTGYGDGGYPTVAGRDRTGAVVSLVSYGFVVPWRLSGLPGEPPKEVLDEEAKQKKGG